MGYIKIELRDDDHKVGDLVTAPIKNIEIRDAASSEVLTSLLEVYLNLYQEMEKRHETEGCDDEACPFKTIFTPTYKALKAIAEENNAKVMERRKAVGKDSPFNQT